MADLKRHGGWGNALRRGLLGLWNDYATGDPATMPAATEVEVELAVQVHVSDGKIKAR